MKKLFLLLFAFFTFATFLTITLPAFAATETGIKLRDIEGSGCTYDGGAIGEIVTLNCIPLIVFNLIYWLLIFAGVVTLFLIIFGGFKFMTSGGDPKAVEDARKTIVWAIVGLVVVLSSFAIVAFISQITGVGCITKFGFEACQVNSGGGGGGAGGHLKM